MPRKGFIPRREAIADPKYDSVLVTRFINAIMSAGTIQDPDGGSSRGASTSTLRRSNFLLAKA